MTKKVQNEKAPTLVGALSLEMSWKGIVACHAAVIAMDVEVSMAFDDILVRANSLERV